MKKTLTSKILIPILILLMVFTGGAGVFAAETTDATGDTDPEDIKTVYLSFDVAAPKGSIVKIESTTYNGKGLRDDSSNVGEFGPAIFSDGTEEFKMNVSTLVPGDYYYKVSLVNQGVANVNYDTTTYTVWLYVEYKVDDNGNMVDEDGNVVTDYSKAAKNISIVLQNDDDTHDKPLGIEFKNTKEETKTVKRTITYTKYTADGEKMFETVTQTVVLKRTVDCDSDGNTIGTPPRWTIESPTEDYAAVDSPTTSGWTPNTARVGVWDIDLDDPKDEIVHVVYTPDEEPPIDRVEVEEYKTVTRTITYTEYTADGTEVSKTVTQTVRLKRTRTEDSDGNVISYSPWEIVEGDQSAVKSPTKEGWTADITEVPFWDIDLTDPRDEVIHVIYTPDKEEPTPTPDPTPTPPSPTPTPTPTPPSPTPGQNTAGGTVTPGPKTGDESQPVVWGSIMGVACLGLILLALRRREE